MLERFRASLFGWSPPSHAAAAAEVPVGESPPIVERAPHPIKKFEEIFGTCEELERAVEARGRGGVAPGRVIEVRKSGLLVDYRPQTYSTTLSAGVDYELWQREAHVVQASQLAATVGEGLHKAAALAALERAREMLAEAKHSAPIAELLSLRSELQALDDLPTRLSSSYGQERAAASVPPSDSPMLPPPPRAAEIGHDANLRNLRMRREEVAADHAAGLRRQFDERQEAKRPSAPHGLDPYAERLRLEDALHRWNVEHPDLYAEIKAAEA